MYNPMKYKSIEELIGTIETDRVALTDGQGLYLQYGETWDADLSQGNAQTWSATKDSAAIELKIAELDAKGDVADMEPLFVWADKVLAKARFEGDVNAFADYLVRDGLAEVYNYTPAEQVAVVSEEDELEEQDEE
jgi:hypothetical protein